jgi:hypothetical protein
MKKKIEYIVHCVKAIEKQLELLECKIVFDYEPKFLDEEETISVLDSAILTYIDKHDKTQLEVEASGDELASINAVTKYLIDFIAQLKEHLDFQSNEVYHCIVFEVDAWCSTNDRRFLGVFTSEALALLEVQIKYEEILYDDGSGMYKSTKEQIEEKTSLDGILISEIQLDVLDD